ncbi:MAG: helix-turn-helix transcriptional regulator [Deltaproteobacteria bacterium]|nr:helix-turn-helix transcriptional regulator [Deltaproteobacteria bacterium]
MKIRHVEVNIRKKQLELTTRAGAVYPVPLAKLKPRPSAGNAIIDVFIDRELGSEAVTYTLASGRQGTVHVDHALDYNRDPNYVAEMVLHDLTVEARRRMERADVSRRELARRLGTSVPQVYRLLDPANTTKSLARLIALLQVLDCDVRFVVSRRRQDRVGSTRAKVATQRPAA